MTLKRWHALAAALSFLVPLGVYIRTLTPTVPFWDSGEFIATSYILGLPHPPGSPVYTMLGRLFTFLPVETIAWRVNFLSALSSALCTLFTFLVVTRALERGYGGRPAGLAAWITCRVGGLAAAFLLAFSKSFWDSAVEAEVYSLSSAIIAFTMWLAFRWWDRIGARGNDLLLVLIPYILSISTGIHLGTILVAPALTLLLILIRPAAVFNGRFALSASILGGFLLLYWMNDRTGLGIPGGIFLLLLAGLVFYYGLNRDRLVWNNLATWWAIVIVLGVTVQLFLLLRSQQMPAINEGMPATLEAWKGYLSREQYGPANPFLRRAELWAQIEHMYLRYVWMQFPLIGSLGPFGAESFWVRAINAIPYVLFAAGAWWNWRRERKTFWFFFVQNFFMGPMLIFYLNFTVNEVRERDYFFTNSYHFIAIWMGMGAAATLEWILGAFARTATPARAEATARAAAAASRAQGPADPSVPAALAPLPSGSARAAFIVGAAALLGIALLPMKAGWFTHDRSGFWIAHDYAYNMLVPLEPNAVVFTNGDNDTFPLWYIQEVENVRRDVRVVNLSLLNTPWYIRQLRDQEPKVPFTYTDAQIAMLQPYLDEKTDNVVLVKDQAVADIVKANAWRKPLYVAVTVPEQLGLERQLSLEGLVFRVHPQPVSGPVDVEKSLKNLYEVFQYRGLLDRNRNYDTTVYKDENAYRLVQNYSAAHVQIAYQLQMAGRVREAIRYLEDAVKISPDFPGLLEYLGRLHQDAGDLERARSIYEEGRRRFPNAAEFRYHVGLMLQREGRMEEAIEELRRACELNQRYFDWFNALFAALWQVGRRSEAVEVLRTWMRAHPEDAEGAAFLKRFEDSLRTWPGEPPVPDRPRGP